MENPIADSPWKSFFDNLSDKGIPVSPTSNRIRFYDMVVKDASGKVIAKHYGLPSSKMGRWRNEYRSYGHFVSTYENNPQSSLTGEVSEVEFIPPTPIVSDGLGVGILNDNHVRKTAREVMLQKRLAKARQQLFSRLNTRIRKGNESQENILVYEKISGNLVFSGDFINASLYIFSMMDEGTWNEFDWVIYVPSKIYERLCRNDD